MLMYYQFTLFIVSVKQLPNIVQRREIRYVVGWVL